jgi:hypothetical protein
MHQLATDGWATILQKLRAGTLDPPIYPPIYNDYHSLPPILNQDDNDIILEEENIPPINIQPLELPSRILPKQPETTKRKRNKQRKNKKKEKQWKEVIFCLFFKYQLIREGLESSESSDIEEVPNSAEKPRKTSRISKSNNDTDFINSAYMTFSGDSSEFIE